MKSYTDLKQSKKLAKFLPLESADMRFCFSHTLGGRITGHYPMIGREPSMGTIPCWSLAALLSVLPYPHLEQNYKGKWCCRTEYAGTTYLWEADSPVDACYEMIIKLHEQKLL